LASQAVHRLPQATPVYCVAFHPHRPLVALGTRVETRSVLQMRDLTTGKVTVTLPHSTPFTDRNEIVWSKDGRMLAYADWHSDLSHTWDVAAGTHTEIKTQATGKRLAFNHAGDLLVTADWEGDLRLWNPHSGQELFRAAVGIVTPRFSPDDRQLACLDGAGV